MFVLYTRLAQTSYQKTNDIYIQFNFREVIFEGLVTISQMFPFLSIVIKFPFCRKLGADVIDIFRALVADCVAEWSKAPSLFWDLLEPWVIN